MEYKTEYKTEYKMENLEKKIEKLALKHTCKEIANMFNLKPYDVRNICNKKNIKCKPDTTKSSGRSLGARDLKPRHRSCSKKQIVGGSEKVQFPVYENSRFQEFKKNILAEIY
jgi:hypothetical protein